MPLKWTHSGQVHGLFVHFCSGFQAMARKLELGMPLKSGNVLTGFVRYSDPTLVHQDTLKSYLKEPQYFLTYEILIPIA